MAHDIRFSDKKRGIEVWQTSETSLRLCVTGKDGCADYEEIFLLPNGDVVEVGDYGPHRASLMGKVLASVFLMPKEERNDQS